MDRTKFEFKDNCYRCVKAWNCYSRDDCKFEELDLERVFDESFDDDKERPFQNIGLDGSSNNSWNEEDDEENNQYLVYCSFL